MIALGALYSEINQKPPFRTARSTCRGIYGEYFVKLCRTQEMRFLLRNEARVAERFSRYDFSPPLVGFGEFADTSCLIYRRVPGVPVRNVVFMTKRMIALISDALERVNETLAKERICQLDPSPNNIIINSRLGRVWYVDYELCAPFGTEAEITDAFQLNTDEEKHVLQRAFRTAGCQYKPAHIVEYGEEFNRYMSDMLVGNLKCRQDLGGVLKFLRHRAGQYCQRAKRRIARTS